LTNSVKRTKLKFQHIKNFKNIKSGVREDGGYYKGTGTANLIAVAGVLSGFCCYMHLKEEGYSNV